MPGDSPDMRSAAQIMRLTSLSESLGIVAVSMIQNLAIAAALRPFNSAVLRSPR